MPQNETLFTFKGERGSEYQDLIANDPDLAPVKAWVECCGKTVYAQYLLSDPLNTIVSPLQNWETMLNGTLELYRSPKGGATPLPASLNRISDLFFRRDKNLAVGLMGLIVLGLAANAVKRRENAWMVLALMVLPILPMMYLVWYGEPQEIERHTLQLNIFFHLSGWLAVPLWLDMLWDRMKNIRLINRLKNGKPTD